MLKAEKKTVNECIRIKNAEFSAGLIPGDRRFFILFYNDISANFPWMKIFLIQDC